MSAKPPGPRRWLFRVTAAVLVPIFFLLLLEAGLRLAHFGYPTGFLLKRTIEGREVYVENEEFGFLFFPPGIARSPTPIVMPAKKEPGTYRIFIFGESAALGDPKPAFGFGRYLEVLLRNKFPHVRFEVICAAMTAINSHALLPVARECARHEGDLWLIYMGNNELIGPFGASGVLGERTPSTRFVKCVLWIKGTRIGQLISAAQDSWERRKAGAEWSGLKMFVGHQVPPTDPARKKVDENYSSNLREMIELGQSSGAKVVVNSVASNLRDCAPHASMHGKSLDDAQSRKYTEAIQLALTSFGTNSTAASSSLESALQLDPYFAEAQFLKGRNLELSGKTNEAWSAYQKARDYDALPFRTTSSLNAIARETPSQHPGVIFLDAEQQIENGPEVPGDELFFDHVHFDFEGNYRLAILNAETIARQLPKELAKDVKEGWISREQCELELGLTDWNRLLAYESMLGRLSDAPYTNQLTNPDTRREYVARIRKTREQLRDHGIEALAIYTNAITRFPEDYYLRQNYAEFLETSGNGGAALAQWQTIEKLIPQHPIAYYQCGRLLNRSGNFREAEQQLKQALAIRFDFAEASAELAKALGRQGKHQDALARCEAGLKLNPENATLHFQKADSQAALGKKNEALEELKTAVRLRPSYWEARYYLGVELASREQVREAEEQFAMVVRIKPDFALGHLNLGVALARQHRFAEAASQFRETLRLDPKNASAQKNLQTAESFLKEAEKKQ